MIVSVYTLEQPQFTPLFLISRYKRYHLLLCGGMACSLKPHLFWLEKSQESFAGEITSFFVKQKCMLT